MKMRRGTTLALTALLAGACTNPAGPDLLVRPIQIDRVDVSILESAPPQAAAHVQGVLGDGCSEFHSLHQERSGNMVTVTILAQRPRDAICTQVARLYEEDIRLEGSYAAGRYVLRVNDFETSFTTE